MRSHDDTWSDIQEQFSRELVPVLSRGPDDRERAEGAARELAARLISTICEAIGSREVYVPRRPLCLRDARNQQIVYNFDGGNYTALGRKFSLTTRHVRRIIQGQKKGGNE